MDPTSVLVLGGANPDSIGGTIAVRLKWLGHQVFVPEQELLDVTDPNFDMVLKGILLESEPTAVVYAVGVNALDWMSMLSQETFDHIMEVNVWGFIRLLQSLREHGGPYSILAITSDAATRPMRTSMAYCASKAALEQVIRVASRELAAEGWRINGLAPGKVEGTAMTRYVDDRVQFLRGWTAQHAEEYELTSSPIRRRISAFEIAAVACDVLLSSAEAWTGDIITVNGGRT